MIIRDEKGFFTNTMENNAHTQIRDAIHPKLLSGEIRQNVNSEDTKDQRLEGKKNEILG
uniref:Uncharacterized protein n=1 Tax=Candidatus Methanophaga sp. ANME-1 ERB7 TaxID=2759913 RepID=A0A7G9Z7P8_9EURY|nr:hypothetical protein INNEFFPN_00041 [Methanosarcinales archaeon ANME-1 ERB7]